jgi:hypothetical protein
MSKNLAPDPAIGGEKAKCNVKGFEPLIPPNGYISI